MLRKCFPSQLQSLISESTLLLQTPPAVCILQVARWASPLHQYASPSSLHYITTNVGSSAQLALQVTRFKATDRREAAGAHSPICVNVAASASLRAVTSEDHRPSPPFQLLKASAEDKDEKKPLLWLWPHAPAAAEPSHNHSPHFNRVKNQRAEPKAKALQHWGVH